MVLDRERGENARTSAVRATLRIGRVPPQCRPVHDICIKRAVAALAFLGAATICGNGLAAPKAQATAPSLATQARQSATSAAAKVWQGAQDVALFASG
jgi:hypothetical protein